MIGFLKGHIIDRNDDMLTLDVGGVGYELCCSLTTSVQLAELKVDGDSQESQLWVHTHVREDAICLFGFATAVEKKMFMSLLKVNGVGPKMAIKILSAAPLDQLAGMIEAGDVKALSTLPKVGKKTAEQLILTLKGKLVPTEDAKHVTTKTRESARFTGIRADVLSALVNLGFRLADAEKVVGELPNDIELQQGIRRGLQALSGSF